MNESDSSVERNLQRAESARDRLVHHLREISKVGEGMMQRTTRTGKNVLVGVGLLGLLGLGALLFRKRKPTPYRLRGFRPERSFMSEAIRSVVLSMLGVLAARAAQRLPLPEPRSAAK